MALFGMMASMVMFVVEGEDENGDGGGSGGDDDSPLCLCGFHHGEDKNAVDFPKPKIRQHMGGAQNGRSQWALQGTRRGVSE